MYHDILWDRSFGLVIRWNYALARRLHRCLAPRRLHARVSLLASPPATLPRTRFGRSSACSFLRCFVPRFAALLSSWFSSRPCQLSVGPRSSCTAPRPHSSSWIDFGPAIRGVGAAHYVLEVDGLLVTFVALPLATTTRASGLTGPAVAHYDYVGIGSAVCVGSCLAVVLCITFGASIPLVRGGFMA